MERIPLADQGRAQRAYLGVGVILPLCALDPGEHGLEGVVLRLGDGVELVVVAARAVDREALEGAEHVRHDVITVEVAGLLLVDGAFAEFDVTDVVPGTCGEHPCGDDRARVILVEHVACELLCDEVGVGFVLVERADHPVPVRPGVRARLVLVVAVGVGVVDDIKPVPRPALAVARRREQAVDLSLVGAR